MLDIMQNYITAFKNGLQGYVIIVRGRHQVINPRAFIAAIIMT